MLEQLKEACRNTAVRPTPVVHNLGGATSKQHSPFLMVPLGCSSFCVGGDAHPKVVMDGDAHMCGDAHLGGGAHLGGDARLGCAPLPVWVC